ncbi:hypothetical protein LP420_31790 [Massilia sp. B-10]|nr:hypothetical protein LP420_31790 [Massilia sp. B-10]
MILIDENPGPGGQIWRGGAPWSDRRAHALWEALQARPGVQMRFGTRVVARAGTWPAAAGQGRRTASAGMGPRDRLRRRA